MGSREETIERVGLSRDSSSRAFRPRASLSLLSVESHNARMIGQLCQRDTMRQAGGRAPLYERALPEMLRFRDSGEIMYELPLLFIPFHLNRPRPPPISLREIPRFRCVQFGRPTKRQKKRGKKGEERRERAEQSSENEPRISRSISLFPLLSFSLPSSPSFLFD